MSLALFPCSLESFFVCGSHFFAFCKLEIKHGGSVLSLCGGSKNVEFQMQAFLKRGTPLLLCAYHERKGRMHIVGARAHVQGE